MSQHVASLTCGAIILPSFLTSGQRIGNAESINVSEYNAPWLQCNNSKHLISIDAWCCLFAGSTITPNYVDNSTSSVAPWCSCSASGSHREECNHFLGYFTDNICLSECFCVTLTPTVQCKDSGFCCRGWVHTCHIAGCLTCCSKESGNVSFWGTSSCFLDTFCLKSRL